jgi:hypothetical protein
MMQEETLEEKARRGPREAQQVAADPSAPAALLERLAQSKDNQILRVLAQNPNTPTNILFRLAKKYPLDVLQNPVIPLLFLENPSVLRAEIDGEAAKSFLSLPGCPEEFFSIIASHKDAAVRAAAASHKKTPRNILLQLKDDDACMVSFALVHNPNTPAEVIGGFLTSANPSIRDYAAKHPNAPQDRLAFLRRVGVFFELEQYVYGVPLQLKDPQPLNEEELRQLREESDFTRDLLAIHPSTPLSVLLELAQDKVQHVRVAVASNPRITEELINLLDVKEYSIQLALCQNPVTPLSVLKVVLERKNTVLQKLIARHPNADEEIITELLTEDDAALRLLARRSGKANEERLNLLFRAGAKDDLEEIEVREEPLTEEEQEQLASWGPFAKQLLAESPHTSIERLWILFEASKQERSGLIVKGLLKNRNLPSSMLLKLLRNSPPPNLGIIVQRADTPPEVLAYLLESQITDIRTGAAFHRDTPTDALSLLWRAGASPAMEGYLSASTKTPEQELYYLSERGPFARELVAQNPHTPPELLLQLSLRSDYWLQPSLIKNPNLPEAAIRNIPVSYGIAEHPNTPADILKKITNNNYYGMRAKVASNHNTSAADLTFLARDKSRMVRDAVASNVNTPAEALYWLALEPRGRLQLALAKNIAAPETVLQRLALHSILEIQQTARQNPSLPADFLQMLSRIEGLDPTITEEQLQMVLSLGGVGPALVAKHPNSSGELLSQVAQLSQKSFALLLAKHPNTPIELLRGYQTSLRQKLRDAVSQNPSCPPLLPNQDEGWSRYLAAQSQETNEEVMLQLASSEMQIREAIARNPSATVSVLEILTSDPIYLVRCAVARHPRLTLSLMQTLSRDRHTKVRASIARRKDVSSEILLALSTDKQPQVRRAVAQNKHTPEEAKERLSRDPKRRVREMLQPNKAQ